MFTGIIETTAPIEANDASILRIARPKLFTDIKEGSSIAVSGVCLTISELNDDSMSFALTEETLQRTTLGEKHGGDAVNLERAMPANGRLNGHIVQGHVDGVGVGVGVGSSLVLFEIAASLMSLMVEKGSITIDGVSLTIASVDRAAGQVGIALVPFTREHTTLGTLTERQKVNIEIDILAKYLYSYFRNKPS